MGGGALIVSLLDVWAVIVSQRVKKKKKRRGWTSSDA
jgi:hypothetical protein